MDSFVPEEISDPEPSYGLWLSTRLMDQLRRSSKLGVVLMVVCYLFALSTALYTLMRMWLWQELHKGDFYLMEGNNLRDMYGILGSGIILYLFVRSTMEGYRAWKYLKNAETNDDDLLEGTERLAKFFYWLAVWGIAFVASTFLDIWVFDHFSALFD